MLNAELGPGALGLEKHEFAHLECPDKVATVPTSSSVEFATEHLISRLKTNILDHFKSKVPFG